MTDDASEDVGAAGVGSSGAKDPRSPGDAGADAPESLAAALSLRRNALVGLAVGGGLAALLFVPRYPALRASDSVSSGYYFGLALVLAATTAAVVTAGLCAKAMLAPVVDRRAWLRRGGTAGVVGGVLWLALPAAAWLAASGRLDPGHWRAATGVAGLLLVVGTAGLHAAVRGGTGESSTSGATQNGSGGAPLGGRAAGVERVTYWLLVLSLLLAAGNASGDAGPVVETQAGLLATPFLTAAFVGFAVAVPWAASAELAGRLSHWPLRAVHVGALGAVLGVAWLFAGGGWAWLASGSSGPTATAAALGVATVPSGAGWAFAGATLRAAATAASARQDST